MHTHQREPDEEYARSWTYRFRESIETGGISFLPSGQNKSSRRFSSSETKQQDEDRKKIAEEIKFEILFYH